MLKLQGAHPPVKERHRAGAGAVEIPETSRLEVPPLSAEGVRFAFMLKSQRPRSWRSHRTAKPQALSDGFGEVCERFIPAPLFLGGGTPMSMRRADELR